MRSRRPLSVTDIAGCPAAAILLVLIAAATGAAQSAPPPPGAGLDGRDPFAEVRERQHREAQLRSAELLPGKATNRRGVEAVVEQVKQDFKRIQILRNEVVRHLLADRPLDYKFIADETGEINKRAGRLKTYLMPHLPTAAAEKDQKKQPGEIGREQLKDALVQLCKRIDSFTENPLFKVPDAVDVEQSARANLDLQNIIQLSGDIKKSTERLNRTIKR